MRESTKQTRKRILAAAEKEMLNVGYPKASMRKIASDAGITAGAMYKHFRGKKEIFEAVCDGIIEKIFARQRQLFPDNLEAKTDEELLWMFDQKASAQMLSEFRNNFAILQMIVWNGNQEYYARKKKAYIDFCVSCAQRYYNELYRRGLVKKMYSVDELYMLSQAEFLALCTFLEGTECQGEMDEKSVQAYETLLRVVRIGMKADSGMST